MRTLINGIGAWFDEGMDGDAFSQLVRFVAFFILLIAFAFAVLVGIGAVIIALTGGAHTPTLFCPNGAQIQTTPATHIVGKVPTDGVEYSCGPDGQT